jgi:hypothetical protein
MVFVPFRVLNQQLSEAIPGMFLNVDHRDLLKMKKPRFILAAAGHRDALLFSRDEKSHGVSYTVAITTKN